jgi:hypothetical protein
MIPMLKVSERFQNHTNGKNIRKNIQNNHISQLGCLFYSYQVRRRRVRVAAAFK